MASITTDKTTGHRTIQFVGSDGRRRSIRLGKVSKRHAESVKLKVEDLAASVLTGHAPSDETSRWVASLDQTMNDKLAAVGLAQRRARATLAAFIDDYITSRSDAKESTRIVFGRVRRYLVRYFGERRPLRDITPGAADKWRLNLVGKGLADNTVRRSSGVAKQFFTAAVRQHLIAENPFADLVAAVKANASRFYFVTLEEAKKVIDACPDPEWKLLFALARYGGLRVPSEALRLRWSDLDWEHGRFVVPSPKTEHHEGGESRVVPIFPELLPFLMEAFERAAPGTKYCITRYRDSTVNLRTQLMRIISRAGLKPWPKLWQNLRSSRETELADSFPVHVASAWIGNSVQVAVKHYLQVTDDHFAQAMQNPVQQSAAGSRTESQGKSRDDTELAICSTVRQEATPCEKTGSPGMGDTGLEPVTSRV